MQRPALSEEGEMSDLARLTNSLQESHASAGGWLQRTIDRSTAAVGSPGFIAAFTIAIVVWIVLNMFAPAFGMKPVDPAPFFWLQGAVGLFAVYAVLMILATQRHEDRLVGQLSRLLVELAVVSDEKSSKIISLLEEGRRDDPGRSDHPDQEADRLSEPLNHASVMKAIQED